MADSAYGGKSGKTTDDMLDKIREMSRNRDAALGLVREFAAADPTLWPILSEIELVLMHVRSQ